MSASSPYLQLKLSWIGLIQFGITLYFVSIAFIHLNDPTTFPNVNTHKRTKWALKNYKVNEEGVKYFNYTDPDTGEKFNGTLSFSWFEERLLGKYVYFFGRDYDNFCWPREIPVTEWFPSMFRSSQLKPWVQVPLRTAVLLGLTFRVFQAIVLAAMRLQRGPTKLNECLMRIFVANELIHNVCLFVVSNYLVTPDKKYLYLFGPALIVVYATFGIKMIFSLWHLGLHVMTACRLVLLCIAVITLLPNYRYTNLYLERNFCDHYTTLLISSYELAAIGCLLVAELLDILQTRQFEVVLSGTEEEMREEEKLIQLREDLNRNQSQL